MRSIGGSTMRWTLLVALAASFAGCGGDSKKVTDAGPDADSDTDADTDEFFFTAKGRLDYESFDVDCPPDLLIAVRADGTPTIVTAICAQQTGAEFNVTVLATDPVVGDITICSSASAVQVAMGLGSTPTSTTVSWAA